MVLETFESAHFLNSTPFTHTQPCSSGEGWLKKETLAPYILQAVDHNLKGEREIQDKMWCQPYINMNKHLVLAVEQ